MENRRADKLLNKYLKGEASVEEKALVETWFLEETQEKATEFTGPDYERVKNKLWENIQQQNTRPKPIKPLWPRIAAVAVILLVTGIGIYMMSNRSSHKTPSSTFYAKNDISPGSNKAILTLSDGSKISLTDAENGKVADQAGISITKIDGRLVYELKDPVMKSGSGQTKILNSISTPKGGQYQINLPDGTKVWLNSASSLKFPATFKGFRERKVELEGEAYFEVFKDKKNPFKVLSKHQVVTVFGTHFNINSYADEQSTKTTLLEGSVCVSSAMMRNVKIERQSQHFLKPGQQSTLNNTSPEKIDITAPSLDHVMAWKNGYFHFDNDNLYTVMRQLSRWYDVDVVYQIKSSDDEFIGDIPRSVNLSEVLKILEDDGVHFRIEGKKIIVTK
ncbi:anti-sigma factor [Pedobacter sp. HMWF019]|uniref:FecR family protein n=1 Tax=Pedobacter sp. HMWF019 TaxID=2056856 RepID=UPI000D3A269B|nr:FecR family protein [Pedobacter sp. HMWF019]PTT01430.1 anti-sigma factor [Pedobacter sp. HMWF019]